MGRSIWKVDGRDSENLQKKRYVANYGVGERALSEEEGLDVTEDFLKQQGV